MIILAFPSRFFMSVCEWTPWYFAAGSIRRKSCFCCLKLFAGGQDSWLVLFIHFMQGRALFEVLWTDSKKLIYTYYPSKIIIIPWSLVVMVLLLLLWLLWVLSSSKVAVGVVGILITRLFYHQEWLNFFSPRLPHIWLRSWLWYQNCMHSKPLFDPWIAGNRLKFVLKQNVNDYLWNDLNRDIYMINKLRFLQKFWYTSKNKNSYCL